MRIAIVGGGIAGLTAAGACLRRPDTEVSVFGQTEDFTAVGAGIVLWPNALRALARLDLADDLARDSLSGVSGGVRSHSGRWLSRSDTYELERRYGPTVALHRAMLMDKLLATVDPGCLRTGHVVESAEADGSVRWRTPSGSGSDTFDLVVAADGIGSRIRNQHWSARPRYSGVSAWRFVLDDYRLPLGSETWGRGEMFGIVPLPGQQVYCYAAAREPAGRTSTDLTRFLSWPDPIPQLVRRGGGGAVLRHDLHDLPPLRSYRQGKIVLIGDAAHAMLPFLGQGACQGIEDAIELAGHLDDLATFDRLRVRRASMVQRRSRQAAQLVMSRNPWLGRGRNLLATLTPAQVAVASLKPLADWRPSSPAPA